MYALDQTSGQRRDHDNDHRPRHKQQPRIDGRISEAVLQDERQRHHSQHLCRKRAYRREYRQREDRYAQQIERQQWRLLAQLPPYVYEAYDGRRDQSCAYHRHGDIVREGLDREYQQAERQRIQHAVAPVQTPPDDPDRVLRQKPIAEYESNDADRDVDGKEPVPRCNRQYSRRKRRAGHRRHGHDRRVDAQPSRQPVARINDAYDRRIDAGNGCGAHALDYAA